jgi:hypothetical protein
MTRYTLTWHGTIVDNQEGWHIPQDPENRHFQEYMSWREQGNWPDCDCDFYALDSENSQYIMADMVAVFHPDYPKTVPIP